MQPALSPTTLPSLHDIRTYGAVSDGRTLCTEAFARAISACSRAGGGVVYCPPGDYLTGTVTLRDHVELRVERGARLLSALEPVPEPGVSGDAQTTNRAAYLIGGVGITDAALTGRGRIDGRAALRFWQIDPDRKYRLFVDRYLPKRHRPKGLVHFRDCTDIQLEGVTIEDPPCYAVWILGCDRVDIRRVVVDTDLFGPNADGLDIDCCRDVSIEGCIISAGDDAIALKSDISHLGRDKPCENVTVSNCRIRTTSCGIRLGYEGDGEIRNCVFNNLVIYESLIGISLMVTLCPHQGRGANVRRGTPIRNIVFSDMVIDAVQALNFWQHKEEPGEQEGRIDGVLLHHIIAQAKRGCYISGHDQNAIGSVTLDNFRLILSGHMGPGMLSRVPDPYPPWFNDLDRDGIPFGIFARCVERLTLSNSEVEWREVTGHWSNALRCEDVGELRVPGLRTVNCPVPEDHAVVRMGKPLPGETQSALGRPGATAQSADT